MTVDLAQTPAGADTGAATAASLTVNFTAATAGNLLVAAANSDATISTPAGWDPVDSAVANQGTYLFSKIADGGETSVTFTPSVTDTVAGGVLEFSGLMADPFDVSESATRSSTQDVTASTGTTAETAQDVELVICVAGPHSFGASAVPNTPTWVTAVNEIEQATDHDTNAINVALFVGWYVTEAAGTQSETCTWTDASQDAGGIIAAFKATSGSAVSGDATQTVTASGTAAGTNSAVGAATDTATATGSAAGTNAAAGAASDTVTATSSATGANSAVGAATQTAAATGTAVGANTAAAAATSTTTATGTAAAVVGSVAEQTVTATGTADAQVTGPTPGSWYTLVDILNEAAEYARQERDTPPVACPNDGEPLRAGTDGELYCPFDGWRPDGTYVGDRIHA
ncbi:MAG TPA: hypothetical protein VGF55_29180 [Gemmataceae bacterium]|jgi:hypothetical protein